MQFPRNKSTAAISRIEIVVVVAAVTVLLSLAIVGIMRAKGRAWTVCCNCNLKQVGLAFRVWEGDNRTNFPMRVSITNGGAMESIQAGQVFSSFQVASNELSTPRILVCPEDSARLPAPSWSSNFNDQAVSYFLSLDAVETNPNMLLSGDRNLTMNGAALGHGVHQFTTNQAFGWTSGFHKNRGNVAMADGSVQILTSAALSPALASSELATNRFAIP